MHYLIQQDLARARTAQRCHTRRPRSRRSLRIAASALRRANAELQR